MQQEIERQYFLTDRELDFIGASLGKERFDLVHTIIKKLGDQYQNHRKVNETPDIAQRPKDTDNTHTV